MEIVGSELVVEVRLIGAQATIRANAIIDTGSTYSVVSRSLSEHLGLESYQQQPMVALLSATEMLRAPLRVLDALEIADARLENLLVVELDLPEGHGIEVLLGMNFLERATLWVDGKGGTFEVRDP